MSFLSDSYCKNYFIYRYYYVLLFSIFALILPCSYCASGDNSTDESKAPKEDCVKWSARCEEGHTSSCKLFIKQCRQEDIADVRGIHQRDLQSAVRNTFKDQYGYLPDSAACDRLRDECVERNCVYCCSQMSRLGCARPNMLTTPKPEPAALTGWLSLEEINANVTYASAASVYAEPDVLQDETAVVVHNMSDLQYVQALKPYIGKAIAMTMNMDCSKVQNDDNMFFAGDLFLTPAQADTILRDTLADGAASEDVTASVESVEPELPPEPVEPPLPPREARKRRRKRKVHSLAQDLWPREIPYVYDQRAVSHALTLKVMEESFKFWEEHTCVRFKRLASVSSAPRDYIVVDKKPGCASYEGRIGGVQPIHVGPNCERFGVMTHEIGHALGLVHEQARPDRKEFISVKWDNVDDRRLSNFDRCLDCDTNNVPYDYGSVMHYNARSFARNNDYTLVPKEQKFLATIGGRLQGPTFYDVMAINRAYCKDTCPDGSGGCTNGGYAHPKNCGKCICPEPFNGNNCAQLKPGSPMPCGGKLVATYDWQTIQSPGYPEGHPDGQQCTWLLQAPDGYRIEFEFTGETFGFISSNIPLCYANYVEVRFDKDPANTGPKLCGHEVPSDRFESVTNKMVVIMRSYDTEDSFEGFQGRFRIISDFSRCFAREERKVITFPFPMARFINEGERETWGESKHDCQALCHKNERCRAMQYLSGEGDRRAECWLLSHTCRSPRATCRPDNKRIYAENTCFTAPKGCVLSEWTAWGLCSATCGTDVVKRRRRRIIRRPEPGGERCRGPFQQTQNCKLGPCATSIHPCNTLPCNFERNTCSWEVDGDSWSVDTGLSDDESQHYLTACGGDNLDSARMETMYALGNPTDDGIKVFKFKYYLASTGVHLKLCRNTVMCTCDKRDSNCLWNDTRADFRSQTYNGLYEAWRPCRKRGRSWDCNDNVKQHITLPGGTYRLYFIAEHLQRYPVGLDGFTVVDRGRQTCRTESSAADHPCKALPCDFRRRNFCRWTARDGTWKHVLDYSKQVDTKSIPYDEEERRTGRNFITTVNQEEIERGILSVSYNLPSTREGLKAFEFKYWISDLGMSLRLCLDSDACTCTRSDSRCLWNTAVTDVYQRVSFNGPLEKWRPCEMTKNGWDCSNRRKQIIVLPPGKHTLYFVASKLNMKTPCVRVKDFSVNDRGRGTCSTRQEERRPDKEPCFRNYEKRFPVSKPIYIYPSPSRYWDAKLPSCKQLCLVQPACKSILYWSQNPTGAPYPECWLMGMNCEEKPNFCTKIVAPVQYWPKKMCEL